MPVGMTGYVNAGVDSLPAGPYDFTYLGAGNSTSPNSFTVINGSGGSITFCTQPGMAACGGGPATPVGTTETLTLPADSLIPFSFTSPAGTVNSDTVLNPSNVSYIAFVPGTTNNIGPGSPGYLGFSDLAFNSGDKDFQDLGVRVAEVPEPASLPFLGVAVLIGVAFYARRRKSLTT